MLGKLALIGTLGLCTAFGMEHRAQDPEPQRSQDPERTIEELERRIEQMAEVFEERFEQQIEMLEEEMERQLEAAAEELEERIEALEEEFEQRIEALEEQIEERFEARMESFEQSWEAEHDDGDSDRNCTPSRASGRRDCTPSRSLISRFQRAHEQGDRRRARRAVEQIMEQHGRNLSSLNSLAWELLTDDDHAGRHDDLAMALAERMLAQREHLNHYMKDTVALALFRAGEVRQAVDLQREAIAEGGNDSDYRRRLATYEQALSGAVAKRIH